jgi:hypothetical protein
MALVPRHDVHLVALDLAAELHVGLAIDDALAELRGHHLGVVGVEPNSRAICSLERFSPMNYRQRTQTRRGWWCPAKIESVRSSNLRRQALAAVSLPLRLGVVVPVLGDLGGAASRAPHAVGPAQRPDRLESLGVVDEGLDVDHGRTSFGSADHLARRVYRRGNEDGITSPESRMCHC